MDSDGFQYVDENGHARATLGTSDLVTPSTNATTHYPAAVVLYDAEGKAIWQAPR